MTDRSAGNGCRRITFEPRHDAIDRFRVAVEVTIRLAEPRDVDALEWFGMFTQHREIIREAHERQQRGENLMLLAVINDFPIGQIWIDLTRERDERTAVLWAFRVFPVMQGFGIGSRLLANAESVAQSHGCVCTEIRVELANAPAVLFYQRRGYPVVREDREPFSYTTPWGERAHLQLEELVLRKSIAGRPRHPERGAAR